MTVIILYLSFASPSDFKQFNQIKFFEGFDKFVHYLLYISLSGIIIFESRGFKPDNKKLLIYSAFVYPSILGGVVELFQKYFFPPRTADFFDWMFDILGIATAWIIFYLYLKSKNVSIK